MSLYSRNIYAPISAWVGLSTLLGAADDDKIVESTNMVNGAYSIAAQPSVPSLLEVLQTAVGTADTSGTITVVGKDSLGREITEVVVPVAGTKVYTTKYFSYFTSITGAGWVTASTNDTIKMGVLASGGVQGVKGVPITIYPISGNIWINDRDIAVADATSLQLIAEVPISFVPKTDVVSLISDNAGATFEVIIWDN